MNTKLYTGNASTQAITGVGFQPDLVAIKERGGSNHHRNFDSVRGATKDLHFNLQDAEDTTSGVTSFDSDGFTLGSVAGSNGSGLTFASWNWKANGAGSSNTDGSITSTVSANTTAGFSIVKWTGTGSPATIGHGLGVAPRMIIMKNTSQTASWGVYHESMGNDKRMFLNTTDGQSGGVWEDTSPTSTVFSVDGGTITGGSGDVEIAYCFAEVAGYSKFGSYVANNNADGAFIYTGFKPTFFMTKSTATDGSTYKSWSTFDTVRQPTNLNVGKTLYLNREYEEGKRGQGSADATVPALDMLSNGVKCRVGNDEINTASDTYIYMAFGQPIISNSGVVATAR